MEERASKEREASKTEAIRNRWKAHDRITRHGYVKAGKGQRNSSASKMKAQDTCGDRGSEVEEGAEGEVLQGVLPVPIAVILKLECYKCHTLARFGVLRTCEPGMLYNCEASSVIHL
jgi:hypothetical protein